MMSVETMRSVNRRRLTAVPLSSGTASGLSLRLRRMTGCGFYPTDQKPVLLSGREDRREDQLLEDRHHLGGLSGTLSERTLIMNKLNLFARFYGQAIEPVIQ